MLFGCEDGTIQCYGLENRQCLFKISLTSAVNCIDFVGQDHFVVGCQDGEFILYSLKDIHKNIIWHESNSSVLAIKSYKAVGVFISRADGTVNFILIFKRSLKRVALTGPNCDPV